MIIRSLVFAFTFVLFLSDGNAQSGKVIFDQQLADSLGADDYGMKNYVLAILKTGNAVVENKAKRDSLFRGHFENIGRLAKNGKLIVAGPLQKNALNYRGLFILDVKTIDEARVLCDSDPAVSAGIFAVEYIVWYGSAALPLYLPFHDKIEKNKP